MKRGRIPFSIVRSLRLLTLTSTVVSASSVCANPPIGRYNVGAETVIDTKTKLVWQRTVPLATYSWQEAKGYCAALGGSLGGTGWRVPTVKELQTIVDDSRADPAIDVAAFPDTPSIAFWSSSPLLGSPSYAWNVYFYTGGTYTFYVESPFAVRCVR
jgi:hypothetical protein